MGMYGTELILDLHECKGIPQSRDTLTHFCIVLCEEIKMTREDIFFWDYEGDTEGYANAPAHLKGTSAVQFIRTSNITIHVLDDLRKVYINVFSCKPFSHQKAIDWAQEWFAGEIVSKQVIERQ
jgi:S-adenosylmethionine/arginine decarboxylase-like enzyme